MLHRNETGMKRTIVAAVCVAGSTVPLTLAAAFLFGCCVLPFHGVVHRVLPLCHMAVGILHGGHDADDADHHPVPPAPPKQQVDGPSFMTTLTAGQSLQRSDTFAISQPRFS